jgi:glycosyltransferase involved in cell wall biosynthesis
MNKTIFIQIASYRDNQLLPTLQSCLENAKYPENLRFGIAWQHNPADAWDNLNDYQDDSRFRILDINYKDSQGACWARNLIQMMYKGEDYTLQLDSHHRFVKNWDEILMDMLEGLREKGHQKPLLTAYIPSFDPDNDPAMRVQQPWKMTFDRFIPEGAIFFLPATIDEHATLSEPVPSRFYSAHFCFTDGIFCLEVPHDPHYYFHGEEISIAARAYTWGYDLFHPHKVVVWHEYTRKGRTKQWDDDKEWVRRNNACHQRNRKLFGMDGEAQDIDFGRFGWGKVRTLEDYERFSGISFKKRAIQQWTMDNKYPPNPHIENQEEYEKSFLRIFKHCIDIGYHQVPLQDYDFWVVAFENDKGDTIFRQDADANEIARMRNDPDGYCKVWRQFFIEETPHKWVVWPHSISEGWKDRMEGVLPK